MKKITLIFVYNSQLLLCNKKLFKICLLCYLMLKFAYVLRCNACNKLERFDFNLIKELSESEWENLRGILNKKEFLCKNCLSQIT